MSLDPAYVFTIDGIVLDPQGTVRSGVRLIATDAVDVERAKPQVIVCATSDADGRFSLGLLAEHALQLFRANSGEDEPASRPLASRGRRMAIIAYSRGSVVGRLDLSVTLDGLADGYDVVVQTTLAGATTSVQEAAYQVTGVLHDAAGIPAAGRRIEVMHQRLREEVTIATCSTGSDGSFRASYDPAPYLEDGMRSLAIVVRVLEDAGGAHWVERLRSARMCTSPPSLELSLTLPAALDESTEIERIGAIVEPRRGSLPWSELTDDDLELIACETRLSLAEVTTYAQAARLAASSTVSIEALYALGRRGVRVSVATIAALPGMVLRRELEAAALQRLVPAWADLEATISQLMTEIGTRAAADDEEAPLGQLLATGGLPLSLRESFVLGYVGRSGTVEEFWQDFAALHSASEVERVRFTLHAGALTSHHLPLVAELEARRQAGQYTTARELAALTVADWQALVDVTGAPETYPGADQAERESLYALALARASEEAFPTAALVQRVTAGGRWSLASTYVAENPSLDLRATNARQFLADHPPVGMSAAQLETLRQELSEAQRMFMVAPRFERDAVATTLLDAGLHSAQQIAAMGASAFVQVHGVALGEGIAAIVYDNAHHVSATMSMLALKHSAAFNPVSPRSVSGEAIPPGDAPPDLAGLLGPLDFCACDHCRSVLGPAAYLVDLLRFLEQQPAYPDAAAQPPFGVLVARRPDLLHTLLDCANTNTPLPTIDLVNEILERDVVGGSPASWPQTTRSAAELRAQPEHRLDDAYDALRTAVYPWALPFDLALAEVGAFLAHAGISWVRVLETCGAPSDLDEGVTHARLGLTRTAAQIVAGEDVSATEYELWGLQEADWFAALHDAPRLLDQAQLDLEGFDALAATTYAGGGSLGISFTTPCQLEGATIDGLDATRLSRMHRMLRLQRALGWTLEEVDTAITGLGSGGADPVDGTFLRSLARVIALHEAFESLPLGELLAWFADLSQEIPAAGGRSPYETIFVEVTAQGETSPLAVGATPVPVAGVMPQLAAALDRTEDEVATLLSLDPARTTSTLANLSWLYRHSSLARVLDLDAREFVTLVRLSDIEPMASLGTMALDSLEAFIQCAHQIRDASVSVEWLDTLLRQQGQPPAGFTDASIAAVLIELIRGLQAVRSEFEAALDPSRPRVDALAEQFQRLLSDADVEALLTAVREVPEENPEPIPAMPAVYTPWLDPTVWTALQEIPPDEDPRENVEHRASLVLEPLVTALRTRQMEGMVVRKLGDALQLSPAMVGALLAVDGPGSIPRRDAFIGSTADLVDAIDFTSQADLLANANTPSYLESGTMGFPSLAEQFEAIRWLAKVTSLITHAGLGDDDVAWLLEHAATHGVLSPAELPSPDRQPVLPLDAPSPLLTPWIELQRFVAFAREHTTDVPTLRAVFDIEDPSGFRAALAAATGWEDPLLSDLESSIAAVADQRGLDAAALRSVGGIEEIAAAFALTGRLGVNAARLTQWAVSDPTTEIARDIQAAVKSRVGSARWPAVIEPVRDDLRERQRDALVAYVLAGDPAATTPEDLFGRLLIDVQTSACTKTSRIKQALSTVQTFVQRVQLNLEPNVHLSRQASTEWEWMARYRVWEANRKIFLWPENWLHPELRDDKTELFTELQNALLSGTLTEASTERAVTEYVQQLDRIAQLHVAGLYHERELGPGDTLVVDRLHVFARTKAKPYAYYYRVRIDDAYWTPWESVPLSIDSDTVIPAVFRRRLFLFWPSFERKVPEVDSPPDPETKLRRHYEIRMTWSQRQDGEWGDVRTTERTVSDRHIDFPASPIHGWQQKLQAMNAGRFFFRSYFADGNGALVLAPSFDSQVNLVVGHTPRFVLMGSHDTLDTFSLPNLQQYAFDGLPRPKKTVNRRHGWVGLEPPSVNGVPALYELEVPHRSDLTGAIEYSALFTAPFAFTIAAPRQYPAFTCLSPFVFQDRERSFFVVPRHASFSNDWTGGGGGGSDTPTLDDWAAISHAGVLPAKKIAADDDGAAPASPWNGVGALVEDGTSAPPTSHSMAAWERWSFHLSAFSHPFTDRFLDLIRTHGLEGLYRPPPGDPNALLHRQLLRRNWSYLYDPTEAISSGSIVDDVDFRASGAYSVYNWELFFHIPMFVALRLQEDKKFAEAQRWMHYVFDPTEGGDGPTPARFWKVRPFFEGEVTDVVEQLEALHYEGDDPSKLAAQSETRDEIARWRRDPFKPHALARLRPSAYQRWVVMRYLDNLMEWGDHLFGQDTIESNNEALQLYVLAAQLLGPRPTVFPAREASSMTYADVQGSIDEFSNFLADAENAIPSAPHGPKWSAAAFKLANAKMNEHPLEGAGKTKEVSWSTSMHSRPISLPMILGIATFLGGTPEQPQLYFCVPHNDELLRYWDLVEDRLFKLRHCLNLEGVARTLPLFQPPIDPGLLAEAAAAGVDLSAALSDTSAPRPHYRLSTMLGLAKELAAEVRGFGSALADALRSTDAEALAELRASQEVELLATLRQAREQRITEAQQAIEIIHRSIEAVTHRRDYYAQRPGVRSGTNASLALSGRSRREQGQIDDLVESQSQAKNASALDTTAAVLSAIPQFVLGTSGNGFHIVTGFGGQQLAIPFQISANILRSRGQRNQTSATIAGIEAGYERRADDWTFQVEQAEKELSRLQQELVAAKLRVAMAQRELADHDAQTANAQQVDAYLRDRYTHAELYRWLSSELSRSYFQAYQLSFEIAKQAQRCYRYELGQPDATFIEFGYWDNRYKGLLAGERLLHDLRRMETAYLANNRREYELTKKISLARLDPFALLMLRQGGACAVQVPEALYELDHPSHYMRRIKSVRLSVIGNTGPFDSVGATLTLTHSEVRTSATSYTDPAQPVVEVGGVTQSIATSTGLSDAGLFETNLRDERYLPFEGRGAASNWTLDLPKVLRPFDYGAIADVVLEIQYTAREGGQAFANQVEGVDGAALLVRLDALGLGSGDYGAGRMWSWSMAARFPEAWAAFRQPEAGQPHRVELTLGAEHYPHPLFGSTLRVTDVYVVLAGGGVSSGTSVSVVPPGGAPGVGTLEFQGAESLPTVLVAQPIASAQHDAFGDWTIEIAAADVADPSALDDLVVVVRYTEGA